MSKRSWTPDQEKCIHSHNGTLLVSAAAGSGKTSVLVQRILERITHPEHPADVDRLLVMTFTRAAVSKSDKTCRRKLKERKVRSILLEGKSISSVEISLNRRRKAYLGNLPLCLIFLSYLDSEILLSKLGIWTRIEAFLHSLNVKHKSCGRKRICNISFRIR